MRTLQTIGMAGLIAVTAMVAEAQTKSARNSTGPAVTTTPRSATTESRSVLQQSPEVSSRMARRLAGPGAKTVTVDDVVAGGVYYEDPVSGKLILGEAPPKGPITVPDSVPGRAPPRVASKSPGIVSNRMVEAPVTQHMGSIEDMTMEELEVGDACCDDGTCGECSSCLVPCGFIFPSGNLELSVGVQGFTGPANQSAGGGSFGFNEGLNWGMPIPLFGCLGGQVGFRATQSNLAGSDVSDDTRRQAFVTAGLFRRVDVGLQGGVVVDWLSDGWHRDVDLVNLRMELSWMIDGTHELGFWGTGGTKNSGDAQANRQIVEWESSDLYAFFYRYNFGDCEQGDARLSAGWSGQGDAFIGADARLPLSATWALETNFAYLIPNEGDAITFEADHVQESWNVAMNLVWYPGRHLGRGDSYYRPLFRVADNGVFMMDRVTP
jgi:hypothetical protein